jgi:hypothetical protein
MAAFGGEVLDVDAERLADPEADEAELASGGVVHGPAAAPWR